AKKWSLHIFLYKPPASSTFPALRPRYARSFRLTNLKQQANMGHSGNSSFKDAFAKSKAFISKKVSAAKSRSKQEDESDDERAYPTSSYTRRMRVIADSERRENPINLGEDGWGDRSWSRVKEEQQKQLLKEREALKDEFLKVTEAAANLESERYAGVDQANTNTPRSAASGSSDGFGAQAATQQDTPTMGGSRANYNRPLPLRAFQDSPTRPPRATRQRSSPADGQQNEELRLPPVKEGTEEVDARYGGRSVPNNSLGSSSRPINPLWTRIGPPLYNSPAKTSGTYNRRGERITPGSFGDNDRKQYLARQGFNMDPNRSSGYRAVSKGSSAESPVRSQSRVVSGTSSSSRQLPKGSSPTKGSYPQKVSYTPEGSPTKACYTPKSSPQKMSYTPEGSPTKTSSPTKGSSPLKGSSPIKGSTTAAQFPLVEPPLESARSERSRDGNGIKKASGATLW
ncbi:hypothetical protein BU23DRAFT_634397, partial [Bimuria novae-zelandiae CBS 107.79]